MKTSHPYRDTPTQLARSRRRRSFWCWLKRLERRFTIWWYDPFKTRLPVRCPECGRRSWDPNHYRVHAEGLIISANEFSVRANQYRCDIVEILREVITSFERRSMIYPGSDYEFLWGIPHTIPGDYTRWNVGGSMDNRLTFIRTHPHQPVTGWVNSKECKDVPESGMIYS